MDQFSLYIVVVLILMSQCVIADPVYGWGNNEYGQLGLGHINSPVRTPTIIPFYKDRNVSTMAISNSYHFAALANGSVYSGGNDYYGCLGFGTDTPDNTTLPLYNPYLTGCKVYIAKRNANAICPDKNLYGWGMWNGFVTGLNSGYWGRVRQASSSNTFTGNVNNIRVVNEAVFVNSSNVMQVAGTGTFGKLGLGTMNDSPQFQRVTFFDDVPMLKMYDTQADHVCSLSKNQSLYCWGANSYGQLGLGDMKNRTTPTLVQGIDDGGYILSHVTFGTAHTLAITCGGTVLAWGTNQFGALGNGVISEKGTPTVQVVTALSGLNVVEIVAGQYSNYARTADNKWYSWGAGAGGILGTNSDTNQPKPSYVSQMSDLNINHIVMGATAKSVLGWYRPTAWTVLQNCGTAMKNECASATLNSCDANANCIDTERSYKCECRPGYSGNGYKCDDLDECSSGTSRCVAGSTCSNSAGGYVCTCPSGYHGNGLSASYAGQAPEGCIQNVNECAATPPVCGANGVCTDTDYNYTCDCQGGSAWNGKTCIAAATPAPTRAPQTTAAQSTSAQSTSAQTTSSPQTNSAQTTAGSGQSTSGQSNSSPQTTSAQSNSGQTTQTTASPQTTGGSGQTTVGSGQTTTGSGQTSTAQSTANAQSTSGQTTSGRSTQTTATGSGSASGSGTTQSGSGTTQSGSGSGSGSSTQGSGATTSQNGGGSTTGGSATTGADASLGVQTIGPQTYTIGDSNNGASSTGSAVDNLINNNGKTTNDSSDAEKKKIMTGVLIGFGVLLFLAIVAIVVILVRRSRARAWAY